MTVTYGSSLPATTWAANGSGAKGIGRKPPVAEYLNAAAIVLETRGRAWPGQFRRWREALKSEDGAAARIARELEHSGLVDVVVDGQQPVRAALRYIRERLSRMNYAEARRQGLPIGSGNVEATCKSLVGLRMKRPGARWKHKTGEEVLQLRAPTANRRILL